LTRELPDPRSDWARRELEFLEALESFEADLSPKDRRLFRALRSARGTLDDLARLLSLSKSTVQRRIKALESKLHERMGPG
jgi:DNA-binding MarR family transcriptional regulator